MRGSWYPCTALAILAFSAACVAGARPKPISGPAIGPTHLRVRVDRVIRRVPLEEYVRGTIISEFDPPSGDPAQVERMLEVQAIISRTYAIAHRSRHSADGFDLCSTTHCQLYEPSRLKTSMWRANIDEAARRTEGMVLWFQNSPARALFHADCGGSTSAAGAVWAGPSSAYLPARRDDGPADAAHTNWRYEIPSAALRTALNADQRTRVGRELAGVVITGRDEGGRAARVTLDGTRKVEVRGEELRIVLTRAFGPRSIRSTKFDVQREGGAFVFTGRGFGHGVGLCQAGAYARLRAGARPEQVLSRYYPGTRLLVLR